MSKQKPQETILYQERVTASFGTFAALLALIPAITLVSEPFDFRIGLAFGFILVLASWAVLILKAPVIEVSENLLRVGPASIERKYIKDVVVVERETIFFERGPGLDPAAYKVFQGTVQSAAKISLNDTEDPTPYWLVSTRKPQELRVALLKG